MNKREVQKRMKYWSAQFRLLNSWRIDFDNRTDSADEDSGVYIKGLRHAGLFCTSSDPIEVDSELYHEMLHLCLIELRSHQGHALTAAEEVLIWDLEAIRLHPEKDARVINDRHDTDWWIKYFIVFERLQ